VEEAFEVACREHLMDWRGLCGQEGRLVADDFYCAGLVVDRVLQSVGEKSELDDAARVAVSCIKLMMM